MLTLHTVAIKVGMEFRQGDQGVRGCIPIRSERSMDTSPMNVGGAMRIVMIMIMTIKMIEDVHMEWIQIGMLTWVLQIISPVN
jgi:hypothetical protein